MLYKQLIELFDILDSASASGAQVVEYFRSIVPDLSLIHISRQERAMRISAQNTPPSPRI